MAKRTNIVHYARVAKENAGIRALVILQDAQTKIDPHKKTSPPSVEVVAERLMQWTKLGIRPEHLPKSLKKGVKAYVIVSLSDGLATVSGVDYPVHPKFFTQKAR